MKKIFLIIAIVIVAAGLFLTFVKSHKRTVRSREWPMGLGRLDAVPARYPKTPHTPAATELDQLARKTVPARVPDPIADYVRAQLQRTDRGIDAAPPIHPDVAAIRTLLLSGDPVAWDVDLSRGMKAPIPNLAALLKVSRLLTASALERARLGDAGAWDDLRAQRVLSRGLWQRPELISVIVAMTIDRNVIGAARKMPLPAPAWFDELRTFDHRRAALAAMQAQTWVISTTIREYSTGQDGEQNVATQLFDRTLGEFSRSELVARERQLANELAKTPACALDFEIPAAPWWGAQPMPNMISVWRRVFRFRAELELTEHALGLRSGSQSRCSDGHWIVTPASVKFSKSIPLDGVSGVIPLEIKR